MSDSQWDLRDHCQLTRRYFYQLGGAAAAAWTASPLSAEEPSLREQIARLQYFTPVGEIKTVLDKAKAGVAGLSPEQLRENGLTPETWSADVGADPGGGSVIEAPYRLDFQGLMSLAAKHTVRFPHICICANGADPFHMTMWEGVPLREIILLTKPKGAIRRVRYESWHPSPGKPFQASLPISQVLETPPGQMPVILAFQMNGGPIPAAKGGPVRVIVPGSYGGKMIKWVRRIALTNDFRSTDTDAADFNNDTESPLKTRARFIHAPAEAAAGKPIVLTGYAQVGISGLARVQYAVNSQSHPWPADDATLAGAGWKDAAILPPSAEWTERPSEWPLRFTLVHWAVLLDPLPPGAYELACRTIDRNGIAQPMPRPFLRSGVTAIHRAPLVVKA